jgi:hypothetical protein
MTVESTPEDQATRLQALQDRANDLERQLREMETESAEKIRLVELKAEAVKAGIIDLDGLRLLELPPRGTAPAEEAGALIAQLRRSKPWLFAAASSSSAAAPPQAAPHKTKLATDMSLEEWRSARADLLRRR